jgi:hypothetical protein
MNAFQYLVVLAMLLLAVLTVRGAARGVVRKRVMVFWLLVWSAAAIAVVWPEGPVVVARALGIGRGADLVLYTSVFITFIGFFYIYTRFRRLDHALTVLVRQLAIEHPVRTQAREQDPAPSDTSRIA